MDQRFSKEEEEKKKDEGKKKRSGDRRTRGDGMLIEETIFIFIFFWIEAKIRDI